MESPELARETIFEIIANQLRANDPPETKKALKRLKEMGYDNLEAKKAIGRCLSFEIFDGLKNNKLFNLERYVKNLNKLPEEPFDDE
ncbi:MAG: hypothetical protein ACYC1Q_04685 [Bacteroidia bacterium]